MDCIFCNIAKGVIPSKRAYEDERILAFHDIHPQAPVHILVIPKVHIPSVNGVNFDNADVVGHIFAAIPLIAKEAGLAEGYRVITNIEKHGCQSVPHLHFHILGGKQLTEKMD